MAGDKGFWETLDLLIGREWKRSSKDDIVQDWVDKVVTKKDEVRSVTDYISQVSNVSEKSSIEITNEKQCKPIKDVFNLPPVECK